MKKKLSIFIGIIVASFVLVFTVYTAARHNAWKSYIKDYAAMTDKILIRNNGQMSSYTDSEIASLPLMANGTIEYDVVKQDNDTFNKVVDEMIKLLSESKIVNEKSIENEGIVKIGFASKSDDRFLYVYENGTAMLYNGKKYLVYKVPEYEQIEERFVELTVGFQADPYFIFNR